MAEKALTPDSLPHTDPATHIRYEQYDAAREATLLPALRDLISGDLSEPYSIYVYRYFLYEWGRLCFLAFDTSTAPPTLAAAIISKLEPHRQGPLRGYIGMLATRAAHRGRGIASALVGLSVRAMAAEGADEVALEAEVGNVAGLKVYERAGFVRSKRLARYYLSGSEAFRLVLYLREGTAGVPTVAPEWGGDEEAEGEGEEEEERDGDVMWYVSCVSWVSLVCTE